MSESHLRFWPANMGAVLETLMSCDMGYAGVDAVVHLAAIPSPGQTNSSEQFRVNTMRLVESHFVQKKTHADIDQSTYNVLEACRKLRITNVILASSETLIGIPFDPHPPEWLPITEE